MNRAAGKRGGRTPELSPEKRAEYGVDDRDIPGGDIHLVNPQVVPQRVPVAEGLEEFRGMMAHGVPPADYGMYDREPKGKPYKPQYERLPDPVNPVPVYIVTEGGGPRPLRHTATKHFQAPVLTAEPGNVVGEDTKRYSVRVLNEGVSGGAGCRIGQLNDLAVDLQNNLIVGGALLPNAMVSYLEIKTQGPLYVLSMDTHTPVISVIIETEVAGAG